MKEQKVRKSQEDQLLDARKSGLDQLHEMQSIRAHGKVLGMNVFSWPNPHVDVLANWMKSIPFKLNWLTSYEQAMNLRLHYPDIAAKVECLVVYGVNDRNAEISSCEEWKGVFCIDDLQSGLAFFRNVKESDCTLLFTPNGKEWKRQLDSFDLYIKAVR